MKKGKRKNKKKKGKQMEIASIRIRTYSRRSRREMTRFSLGGDDDDDDEYPLIFKRPRIASSDAANTSDQRTQYCEEMFEDDDVESVQDDDEYEEDRDELVPEFIEEHTESEEEEEVPEATASISVTLTDPDVLDCPICFLPLSIPVFQCENGHVACDSCCFRISNKCASCCMPIGYNRCRAIEKVIESVKISCRNAEYGCKESLVYSKKLEHENSCIYTPCSCPLGNCAFLGPSKELYAHLSGTHPDSAKVFHLNSFLDVNLGRDQKHLILQEGTESMVFVLNHHNGEQGSAVNLICIGPESSKKRCYYEIFFREGDSRLRYESFAEFFSNWSMNLPLKRYLLVPNDFIGSCGRIKLELCVWTPSEQRPHV